MVYLTNFECDNDGVEDGRVEIILMNVMKHTRALIGVILKKKRF